MASAYELLVMVRAQNMASNTLRSVARDLNALSGAGAGAAGNMRAINNQRWQNVSRAGTILRDTGRAARLFGVVTGAALGYAAVQAANFESEVTLAATQTGRANKNMFANIQDIQRNSKLIGDGILAQMREFPATSHEMAAAAYEIFSSLDTTVPGGVALLKVFNKAAVAGMTDLQSVTKSGVTVLNDFFQNSINPAKDMTKAFQRMFAAVRFGRMTFAEFAQSMNTTVPAAKSADQTLDTLSGTMAFMTRRMPNVRMAGTSVARLMELLGRKKMVDGLKAVGVEITNTDGRMKQLPQIMDILLKKFPELAKGGELLRNFFKTFSKTEGTIMARRAFVFLAKDMALYRQMMHLVTTDNSEFDRSFATLSQTGGVRWKVFLNRLRSDIIKFGQAALPTIESLARPIERLMHWFEKLDDSTKKSIGKWAVYAAAILLVGGTISSIAGGILNLIGIMGRFGLLGAGFLGLFLRLGFVLVGAQLAMGHFGHSIDLVGAALNGLKSILSGFLNFATSGWANFGVAMLGAGLLVKRMATTRAGMLTQAGKSATAGGILSTMLFGVGGIPGFRKTAQVAEREVAAVAATAATMRAQTTMNRAGKVFVRPGMMKELQAAERSSGRIASGLRLAGAAAIALPGPLKIAAVAMGVIGIAAFLWKRHMDSVKERLAAIKYEFDIIARGATAAGRFGQFGLDARNMERAHLNVQMIRTEIQNLKKEISKAEPGAKPMMQEQLHALKLDLADALDVVSRARAEINKTAASVVVFANNYVRGVEAVGMEQGRLNKLIAERNKLLATPDLGRAQGGMRNMRIMELNTQIEKQKALIQALAIAAKASWATFKTSFDNVLRTLTNAGAIPPIRVPIVIGSGTTGGPSRSVVEIKRELARVVASLGGVSVKQLKMLIKAELDPSTIKNLPARLRAALLAVRKETIKVNIEFKAKKQIAGMKQGEINNARKLLDPLAAADPFANLASKAAAANTEVHGKFKTVKVHTQVLPPANPSAYALGLQIMSDIDAGAGDHTVDVTILTKHIDTYEKVMKKAAEIKSPSRRFAREIGKPIGQGIAVGLLESAGFLNKTALFTIDDMFAKMRQASDVGITLFAGEYMQKLEERIKPLTLIQEGRLADLQAKAEAGKKMSQAQIAAMHQLEARKTGKLKPIDLLKDLRGQLVQLRQFSAGLSALASRGAPVELLNQLRDLGTDGTKYITQLANMTDVQLARYINTFKAAQAETKKLNDLSLGEYTAGLKAGNDQLFQFEQGIKKLRGLKVPSGVIDYFIQKGLSGLNELNALLATKSPAAFRAYVNEILRGNRLITASNMHTRAEMVAAQKEMWDQARQIAHDRLIQIRDMYVGFMGQMFSNISVLPSLLGSFTDPFAGLDAVMQAHSDALQASTDAASQAQQAAEQGVARQKAIDDAMLAEHDRLQSAMGDLFSGPIATNLAGFTLSIGDLQDDLRAQIDAFKDWRSALSTLGQRGVPQAMLAALEQLGPQATENLQTLANASDTDLRDYINMWKESQSVIDDSIDKNKVMADAMQGVSDSISSVATAVGDLVPTMADLLEAQKANSAMLVTWAGDLATLAARHIPRELLQEIMDLGPSAAAAVHLLATSSDADLTAFTGSWQKAHDTIAGLNADLLAITDPSAILQSLRDQNEGFQNWQNDLATVRQHLLDNGVTPEDAQTIMAGLQDLGPDAAGFIHAMTTMSDPQLQEFVGLWKTRQAEITTATETEFKKQVAMWRTHGQNIAIALVNGVADEQGILEAWFRNLFLSLMGTGTVPSTSGLGIPASGANPGFTDRGTSGGTAQALTGGGGGRGTSVSMVINAHQTESLDTTLARASFRLRNQSLT